VQSGHVHLPFAALDFPEERAVSHSTWDSPAPGSPGAPKGLCEVNSMGRSQPQSGEKGSPLTFAHGTYEAQATETLVLNRIMRNYFSALFTATKDIFFLLETPQGGCFSWLLRKRDPPWGIAWVGVCKLGAARQHIKESQGHQKQSLATFMSKCRAVGTSSDSFM